MDPEDRYSVVSGSMNSYGHRHSGIWDETIIIIIVIKHFEGFCITVCDLRFYCATCLETVLVNQQIALSSATVVHLQHLLENIRR